MTCDEARARLLEAEPDTLRGEGDETLALHLRHCPRCAAAAGAILAGTAALDAYLDASARAPVDPARMEVVLRALGVPSGPSSAPDAPRRRPTLRRAAWAPLAMAAAAAGLLFLTRGPEPVPEDARPLSVPGSLPAPPAVPVVEGASAATVAVINTDNPDITVLWFF